MAEKIREYAMRLNGWLAGHWRMVIWCMLMVIMMQQCTISRLRWEVTQMTRSVAQPPAPTTQAAGDTTHLHAPAAENDTAATDTPTGETASPEANSAGNVWLAILSLVALAGIALGIIYMRRNGIYPIGITLRGKLKSDLTYHIKVSNHSRSPIEVSEPLVVFIMGGATRKFRANVAQLPMTLSPKTSFEADINLTGLVRSNLELASAKAISMSIATNGKRHSAIPTPVRIKTA